VRTWLRRRDGAELSGIAILAGFLFVTTLGPLAVSVAVSPDAIDRGEVQLTPPCEVRARTGRDCSTCGMTRGFCAMSRLRVGDAVAYNAAAPWLYLATFAGFVLSGATLFAVAREWLGRAPRAPALA